MKIIVIKIKVNIYEVEFYKSDHINKKFNLIKRLQKELLEKSKYKIIDYISNCN